MALDILVGNKNNLTKLYFLWVEYEMGLFFLHLLYCFGEFFFSQWRWRSLRERTRILISPRLWTVLPWFFHTYIFSLVGDFWVGKFVKVHGKRSEKPVGLLLGEVKSKPKEKVAESDAPKEEPTFHGGWKGSKNDKPRNVLFGWLVGHKRFIWSYMLPTLGIPHSVGT